MRRLIKERKNSRRKQKAKTRHSPTQIEESFAASSENLQRTYGELGSEVNIAAILSNPSQTSSSLDHILEAPNIQ